MKDAIIYAGYSRDKSGVMRFRTATNESRVFQLTALGEEVYMIEINPVYSKSSAAKELLRLDHARGVVELEKFYSKFVRDENVFKAPKKARTVTVKATEQVRVSRGVFGKVYPEIPMTPKQAEQIRNEFNAKHKDLV